MSDPATFDPERFEDKYVHYFAELQAAYKNAFETMTDRYDSDLVHAIDQRILSESEPFYDGDGRFRIELPEDPDERLVGFRIDRDQLGPALEEYTDELERELRVVFGFESGESGDGAEHKG